MTRLDPTRSSNTPSIGGVLPTIAIAGVLAVLVMAAMPADALAQATGERLRPPAPQDPSDPPVIRNLLIAILVVASIIAASLIPAKRGHQD